MNLSEADKRNAHLMWLYDHSPRYRRHWGGAPLEAAQVREMPTLCCGAIIDDLDDESRKAFLEETNHGQ